MERRDNLAKGKFSSQQGLLKKERETPFQKCHFSLTVTNNLSHGN